MFCLLPHTSTALTVSYASPHFSLCWQVLASETFTSISVTAEGWLKMAEVKPGAALVGWLRQKRREGFAVVGLEQTARSVSLSGSGAPPLPERMVLLLGKEKEGIPADLLREVRDIQRNGLSFVQQKSPRSRSPAGRT